MTTVKISAPWQIPQELRSIWLYTRTFTGWGRLQGPQQKEPLYESTRATLGGRRSGVCLFERYCTGYVIGSAARSAEEGSKLRHQPCEMRLLLRLCPR